MTKNPTTRIPHPPIRFAAAATLALALAACGSGQPRAADPEFRGLDRAQRSADPEAAAGRPAVVAGGDRIEWSDLRAALSESAGAVAIEEAILGRELRRRAAEINFDPAGAITAEERLLVESVAADAQVPPSQAGELVARFRADRGLGPARYRALLERSAILRRLIAAEITLTPEELDLAAQLGYGPRIRARYYVAPSQSRAAAVRDALLRSAETTPISIAFAQQAMADSIDPTAARGGLLDPISPVDPALPAVVRSALENAQPGALTQVLSLDVGYALLLIEDRIPGRAPTAAELAQIERRVRTRKERFAMEQLARQILADTKTTVFDPALRWSWESRPGIEPQQ